MLCVMRCQLMQYHFQQLAEYNAAAPTEKCVERRYYRGM